MKRHIVAAIFARGGSKGVPRKNIRLLGGKPLIAHSIEVAKAIPMIDRIIVSTDDDEIASVARKYGAEIPFKRPAELARDDSPEWLAWRHAIQTLQSAPGAKKIDVLVSLPSTSPLRAPEDVKACIQKLIDSRADIVVTVREANRNPYFNMVVMDETDTAKLIISPLRKIYRRQDAPPVYDITTVAYAVRPKFVLTHDTLFEGHVKGVVVPVERAMDIDSEWDFKLAEFLMNEQASSAREKVNG